jgi:(p)ppGpp synthase/HD superfamily hydrolase
MSMVAHRFGCASLYFLTQIRFHRFANTFFFSFATMSNLQRAIEIAVAAHSEHTRKDGSPYILHPLRLMMAVKSDSEKIVAVLHDVVEDTPTTFQELRDEGFSDEVLDALQLVTHDSEDTYEQYIAKIQTNPIARAVKLADLRDNSNIFEIPKLSAKDLDRLLKYHNAFKILSEDQ